MGSGFRAQGSGCRVQVSGFRVQGAGCRVQSSGCKDLLVGDGLGDRHGEEERQEAI